MSEMTVTYVRTQRKSLERKLTEVINQAMREFEENTEMTVDSIAIDFGTYTRKDGVKGTEVDRIAATVTI
jgi:predicted NUDIX family NTP pyrophosphohydrolase